MTWRTVRLGDRGYEVRQLQLLLNGAFNSQRPRLKPDGDFGQKTEVALKHYQASKKLTADGVAGPATWRALGLTTARPSAPVVPEIPDAPWIRVARAELGVQEDPSPVLHNARIVEYHQETSLKATTDEVPWCSSFVNWVMVHTGYPGTGNALAASWLKWGRTLASPRLGAITVVRKKGQGADQATGSSTGNHVGFCIGFNASTVTLLGGNQAGGTKVAISTYPLKSYEVRGYQWPTTASAIVMR